MSRTLEERVIKIIGDQLGIDDQPVKPEHHLEEDLGADSLDLVEIVIDLECEFEIDITDEDFEGAKTVQAIVDLINRLTA